MSLTRGGPFFDNEEAFSPIVDSLLNELPENAVFFLSQKGNWQKNPRTWEERINHELLYRLKKEAPLIRKNFIQITYRCLNNPDFSSLAQKINSFWPEPSFPLEHWLTRAAALPEELRPSVLSSVWSQQKFREDARIFISFIRLIANIILSRCFELNSTLPGPDWDVQARQVRSYFGQRKQAWEEERVTRFSLEEKELFYKLRQTIEGPLEGLIAPIAQLVAEEQRISLVVENLFRKLKTSADKEAIYQTIIEKWQPPMGIVANLSPSLFFLSLYLLILPEVELSSGLQHAAAVSLSLFRDQRSADYLLYALEKLPIINTKIRENVIYTLGCLKEARAVPLLTLILDQPDFWPESDLKEARICPLQEQKEEAIWALGKIGLAAVKAIPLLSRYAEHPSAKLKTYLAWSLGEIGRAQKENTGGISADLLIALLKLLKEKNKEVFEEATSALKKIQMPEFIHTLYLYHVGAVNLLSLKPAATGLNELSATLNHFLSQKKRTVMAVTGDSGTGKTYFCQVLAKGLAGVKPAEILYLMRDSKNGRKIFNRLLGLSWLKKYIDPAYYQSELADETASDSEAFWPTFLETHKDKKFILLDGCRDRHYFQRVVDLFYERGELDVVVNLRANFSTRRLNLEEREVALESVRLHLSFLEEPALEDTYFYQEGKTILYDLDNSLNARLSQEEIAELFAPRVIPRWEEFIQLGSFKYEHNIPLTPEEKIDFQQASFRAEISTWPESQRSSLQPEEQILKIQLNEALAAEPNLLYILPLTNLKPERLQFYAQEQVGGAAEDGTIFVLTLLDHRLFRVASPEKPVAFAILNQTFYLADKLGGLISVSLEKEEKINYHHAGSAISGLAAIPPNCLLAVEKNGLIRLWNFEEKKLESLNLEVGPINSLASAPGRRAYLSAGTEIIGLDWEKGVIIRMCLVDEMPQSIYTVSKDRIIIVVSKNNNTEWGLIFINFNRGLRTTLWLPGAKRIKTLVPLLDGRVVIIFEPISRSFDEGPALFVLNPEGNYFSLARVNRRPVEVNDLLILGPRIITCGRESDGPASFRLWGSEFFVQAERSKLKIKPF